MADESEFKLRVHIDELLDIVVVVAKRQHLIDEELEREVAGRLLQLRLNLVLGLLQWLLAGLIRGPGGSVGRGAGTALRMLLALKRFALNVDPFNGCHREGNP